MAEDQRLAHPGALRQVARARAVEALLGEHLEGGVEDLRAAVVGRQPSEAVTRAAAGAGSGAGKGGPCPF
jgi:hypothetical protein